MRTILHAYLAKLLAKHRQRVAERDLIADAARRRAALNTPHAQASRKGWQTRRTRAGA